MNAAILIPLYKKKLSKLEEIAITQCFSVLKDHPIIAIKPKSLSLGNYSFPFKDIVDFDDQYFASIEGYNKLMLSAGFYEKFLQYKYILIHQTDAFVFKNELTYWCEKRYDYIGAPWLRDADYPDLLKKVKNKFLSYIYTKQNKKLPNSTIPHPLQFENKVGNGGFSLRNTQRFYDICKLELSLINAYNNINQHRFNEDSFWGIEVNREKKRLRIPDYKEALEFSIENGYHFAFKLNDGKLPFGCHAWDKNLDFWQPIIADFGYDLVPEK